MLRESHSAEPKRKKQEDTKMEHLVYCDNAEKKGEKELDKILAGIKTMVVRGAAGAENPS